MAIFVFAAQSMVVVSAMWASPGNLLEIQDLRHHSRPAGSEHAFNQDSHMTRMHIKFDKH